MSRSSNLKKQSHLLKKRDLQLSKNQRKYQNHWKTTCYSKFSTTWRISSSQWTTWWRFSRNRKIFTIFSTIEIKSWVQWTTSCRILNTIRFSHFHDAESQISSLFFDNFVRFFARCVLSVMLFFFNLFCFFSFIENSFKKKIYSSEALILLFSLFDVRFLKKIFRLLFERESSYENFRFSISISLETSFFLIFSERKKKNENLSSK